MNNTDQIEQLFQAHYEVLHRYAFSILRDNDDAKDIVQSVFLNFWEKRDTLNMEVSPKAYLFRSVYNQCINHVKKEAYREKQYSLYVNERLDELGQQADELRAIGEKIDQVLNQLPPQCRAVFKMSRGAKKKYAEIASELGISIKTVEAHMGKALKLIREILRVLIVVFCLITDLNL